MPFRSNVATAIVSLVAVTASAALADPTAPPWNPAADHRMTTATSYTIAPISPIPYGAVQIAKLSNGAKLVPAGDFLDLHDRSGRVVARFDHAGRTLEPPDRPVDLKVTKASVMFLGEDHTTLMTLPRK